MAKSTIPAGPRSAYSVAETIESFGCSRDWLYRQLRAGTIRSIKIGGRRFIPASEWERILNGDSA